MYEILVQLYNEGYSLMFQGFFKVEIASGEILSDSLSYQPTPKQ